MAEAVGEHLGVHTFFDTDRGVGVRVSKVGSHVRNTLASFYDLCRVRKMLRGWMWLSTVEGNTGFESSHTYGPLYAGGTDRLRRQAA